MGHFGGCPNAAGRACVACKPTSATRTTFNEGVLNASCAHARLMTPSITLHLLNASKQAHRKRLSSSSTTRAGRDLARAFVRQQDGLLLPLPSLAARLRRSALRSRRMFISRLRTACLLSQDVRWSGSGTNASDHGGLAACHCLPLKHVIMTWECEVS